MRDICSPLRPSAFSQVCVAGDSMKHTNAPGIFKTPQVHEETRDAMLVALARSRENGMALVSALKMCTTQKDLCRGSKLHAEALKKGYSTTNSYVGNSLLYMYEKCGSLAKAKQVFDELLIHDVASWTSLLVGYAEHGHGKEALNCFEEMQHEGLAPDGVAFACILKACAALGASEKGKDIHLQIVTKGLLGEDVMLGTALVDMYAKLGELAKARQVLEKLPVRNVITWNALTAGYCQWGLGDEALDCFDRMKQEGLSPSSVTFACILKACGNIGAAEKGEEIHAEIIVKGFLEKSTKLKSALMDMYAKCGALAKARLLFEELVVRDVVAWTALITGYCQHGLAEEALNCLEEMKHNGISPNAMTFSCILKACGSIGAAEKGKEIHVEVVRTWMPRDDTVLGNALVYMYAKCGILLKAKEVFDELVVRSIVSWSALIIGYLEIGCNEEALGCFECMKQDGLAPDEVIFACILKACGSIGAAEKGQTYFETMSTSFGIIPSYEHRSCMVGLFCQMGRFEKAMTVIKKMPSSDDHLPAWMALLGACRKWGNVKLGRFAFDHAIQKS